MRNTLKIALFFVIVLAVLLFVPSICNAANLEASDEATLLSQISSASENDVIVLTSDIELSSNVAVTINKNITIDGQGQYKLYATDDWYNQKESGDQSLITVHNGSTVTLKDITLTHSQKYGVQAFNGGAVILDNVTVSDCKFGGVLVNGGTVTVKSVNLGSNLGSEYNGIELGKGGTVTNNPTLIMDGEIASAESEVINIATNDNLTAFTVQNTENTSNKIAVVGNQVVITDSENNVVYTSNDPVADNPDKTITGTENSSTGTPVTTEKYIITVNVDGKTVEFVLEGSTLTADDILAKINLDADSVEGYYKEAEYTNAYDFSSAVTANTEIYVKLAEEETTTGDEEETVDPSEDEKVDEKDETPKTGVSNYIGIAAAIAVVSLATIVVIKKKNA